MEQWQQYHVMAPQLVPSTGIVLLTVSAKCPTEKQTSYHWTVETLCMDRC